MTLLLQCLWVIVVFAAIAVLLLAALWRAELDRLRKRHPFHFGLD